jgi:hypothetical protein
MLSLWSTIDYALKFNLFEVDFRQIFSLLKTSSRCPNASASKLFGSSTQQDIKSTSALTYFSLRDRGKGYIREPLLALRQSTVGTST